MTERIARSVLLEVDFQNKFILDTSKTYVVPEDGRVRTPSINLDKDMMERFLESMDPFWHTENDKLEALVFYSDNVLYCQRKKLKYDFASGQKVYSTYTFTGYTTQQVIDLRTKIETFIKAQDLTRIIKIERSLQKVDENILFFEKTYLKRMQERSAMLAACDWRILPDVVDTYEGEKDRWIYYRAKLRELKFKDPTEYETPLAFFRAIKTLKWPIDPKTYNEQYPGGLDNDGNPVEYLATDDQWVERDTDASRDLVESRLSHISTMRQNYINSRKIVASEVKEMMKNLRLEDFVDAGIDYTKIYTEGEIDDLVD